LRIILLSGFLGAGKTSVLMQLAKYLTTLSIEEGGQISAVRSTPDNEQAASPVGNDSKSFRKPSRVAILENEIGQVSVDSATLSELAVGADGIGKEGFALRELFSGCVCCSLTGEMIDTVRDLQSTVQPQWLIIEATGLAVPENAAAVLREGIADLDGLLTIVLIDAARFMVLEKVSPLVAEQAKTADVLLLNKVDLVSDAAKGQVLAKLRALNNTALILEVVASKPIAVECFEELIERV
jgi:G3E family GTPase